MPGTGFTPRTDLIQKISTGGVNVSTDTVTVGGVVQTLASWLGFLDNKMNREVSAADFGAKCDSSTDDSPAFVEAGAALPHGGIIDVPATGHSCVLKEGITLPSGVQLSGVGAMYWPGPYDNNEADWTAFGSHIRCDDKVNSCITINGNGSGVHRVSFWYTQPTPPGSPCGTNCVFSHAWTPTNYPYTITLNGAQNFNDLSDIQIINATNCISIQGAPTGVSTIFTHLEHMYLGCFNTGMNLQQVDNTVKLDDIHFLTWWYQFNPNLVGYTEGDSTSAGHAIGMDMYYVSGLQADGLEFYQDWAAIRATDASVTSGLGTVTFAAQALQFAKISFNQVCQAITLTSGTTHFSGRFSTVILNVDPQTSGISGQCGQQWPYAFNLASDNVDVSITDLDGYYMQSLARVGNGTSGLLHLFGARVENYSAYASGGVGFNIAAGGALDMPYDLNALFSGNPNAGAKLVGSGNWPNVSANGTMLPQMTVAGLASFPCNATYQGEQLGVTDAVSPTYLGKLTGGGSVKVIAYCNGSAWIAQ